MNCVPILHGDKWTCGMCGFTHDKKFRKTCRSKGAGDTAAKFFASLGLQPCDDCKKRKEILNDLFPYRQTVDTIEEAED